MVLYRTEGNLFRVDVSLLNMENGCYKYYWIAIFQKQLIYLYIYIYMHMQLILPKRVTIYLYLISIDEFIKDISSILR